MLQAARVEAGRLVILVDQRLQLGELAPALGPGQRRGQMVDDHRGGAPLGLGALAGVVDDERVEVRQRPQHGLGQAVGREGGGLARQPLEVAMLAEMDDRVRPEARAAARDRTRDSRAAARGPARGRSRPDRCGSRAPAAVRPRRCPAAGPTSAKPSADDMRVALRLAPARLHAAAHLRRQAGEQLAGSRPAAGLARHPRAMRGPPARWSGRSASRAHQLGAVVRGQVRTVARRRRNACSTATQLAGTSRPTPLASRPSRAG